MLLFYMVDLFMNPSNAPSAHLDLSIYKNYTKPNSAKSAKLKGSSNNQNERGKIDRNKEIDRQDRIRHI